MLCQDVSFDLLLTEGLYSGVGAGLCLEIRKSRILFRRSLYNKTHVFSGSAGPASKACGLQIYVREFYLRVPDQSRTWICG